MFLLSCDVSLIKHDIALTSPFQKLLMMLENKRWKLMCKYPIAIVLHFLVRIQFDQ